MTDKVTVTSALCILFMNSQSGAFCQTVCCLNPASLFFDTLGTENYKYLMLMTKCEHFLITDDVKEPVKMKYKKRKKVFLNRTEQFPVCGVS